MAKDRPTIRTFICIELPDTIKERIDTLTGSLREINAQVSWVRATNVHLTIRFLGEVSPPRLERVHGIVQRAAASVTPFEIEVGGTGCFPSTRNPRVLWVGLTETPPAMIGLYEAIETGLAGAHFDRETKRFSPHLTIGRVRSPRNGQLVAERLVELGFPTERFTARDVIVMRSDLSPSGSVYTPQFVAQLGGSSPVCSR